MKYSNSANNILKLNIYDISFKVQERYIIKN